MRGRGQRKCASNHPVAKRYPCGRTCSSACSAGCLMRRADAQEERRMWALIRAVSRGDQRARQVFCLMWRGAVQRDLWRIWRDSPLRAYAADAEQEVFLECLRPGGALARFDPSRGVPLRGYLRGVVRNVAARVARREASYSRHNQRAGDAVFDWSHGDGDVLLDVEQHELRRCVERAIVELQLVRACDSHSMGELVRLLFHGGLPVRSVARRWGLPPERVHELRRRACRLLRRRLRALRPHRLRPPGTLGPARRRSTSSVG